LVAQFSQGGLYLAAILLLPGALIGAPILWWLGHRRKTPAATDVESMLLTQRCQEPRLTLATTALIHDWIERSE